MKTPVLTILCLLAGFVSLPVVAQSPQAEWPASEAVRYASIRQEILHAIHKGNSYLKSKQASDGTWGETAYPAMTALPVTAAMRAPGQIGKPIPEYLKKSYEFILNSQQEDGSIFNMGLASYNTSVCMMALLAADNPAYDRPLLKARAFLIKQQEHFAPDSPYYGGIGYGGSDGPPIADLSNTSMALEAIYYSRHLAQDGRYGPQPELNWEAAAAFVARCQQDPAKTQDPTQAGGFMYRPAGSTPQAGAGRRRGPKPGARNGGQSSPATKHNRGEGYGRGRQQAAASAAAYGSMTYAGMQSLIYANLGKNDQRVQAALRWMANNYTVEENPGMGDQGLYYYYQAIAKALNAAQIDMLNLADGTQADWRYDLADKLLSLQKADGSWVNTNNRWWEADPIIVTSYTILALEQIYNSILIPE